MKKYNKYRSIILFIALAFSIYLLKHHHYANCNIHTINFFSQAAQTLDNLDEHALVLFDVDDTLLTEKDPLARGFWFELLHSWWFRLRFIAAFPQLLFSHEWEDFFSLVWQQIPRTLIEPQVIAIIDNLKTRGISVLALTSMESGAFGVIPNMPEWRYQMLAQMGIIFTQRFRDVSFTRLAMYRDNFPSLYKGILCTNQQPKGEVLADFLDRFNLKPSTIIFFDDDKKNLLSVGSICKKRNISYQLFCYKGENRLSKITTISTILKQVKILLEKRRWMSYSSAS